LFEASQGTGARNNGAGGPNGQTVNPWAKQTWNLTKQGEAYKKNPDQARKMAAEHGHTIA
jgi:hypothetical protein